MDVQASQTQSPYWQVPALSKDNRLVGGVAAGIAEELGVEPWVIRLAFIVLGAAGGWGVLLYGVAWALMATLGADVERRTPKARTATNRLLGVGLIVNGLLLVFRELGGFADSVVWPIALCAAGLVVAHHRGLDLQGTADRLTGDQDRSAFLVRVAAGSVLVMAGIALAVSLNFDLRSIRDTVLVVGVVVAGLAVVLAPWVIELANDLTEERRARIRSDERAAMAAHLHDSVLQTLALIQRRAEDPQVVGLARKQERELRSWLFGQRSVVEGVSFRAQLERELAEIEELHTVPVDVVAVGDSPVDDELAAILAATREAVTNAVVHAGAPTVDVFAEVRDAAVDVFVRDTGRGFDPQAVPADRRGVADSIIGRVERVGGTVSLTSEVGAGTEVEIHLERST